MLSGREQLSGISSLYSFPEIGKKSKQQVSCLTLLFCITIENICLCLRQWLFLLPFLLKKTPKITYFNVPLIQEIIPSTLLQNLYVHQFQQLQTRCTQHMIFNILHKLGKNINVCALNLVDN